MTRLYTAGAELQSVTAKVEFTAVITNAPAVETTIKRSGNAAWRIHNTSAIEGFRIAPTATAAPSFFRFYLYIVALPTATAVIGGARITGASKASIRLTTSGALQLWNTEDNSQVGSDSSALSTATWYRIELSTDPTTLSATAVEARAYADTPGATAFWNPSGTMDLAASPTAYGCYTTGGDATLDYIVDDLAINDSAGADENTWCGEGEVIVLRPNGNGDNSQWTGSDGNSTDNYLLVNETPPDTSSYVQSNTSGQIDDYELEATPAAMASNDIINVVHVGVYAAVDDATSADPNIVLRIKASSGGTVEESATLDCNSITFNAPAPLPANDNYHLTLYDLPGGSTTPWTKADLDTAQVGIREDVSDTNFARVAAIWVMVDHKPASGQTVSVAQVTETDLAQAIAKQKLIVLGQVAESNVAQAIVRQKLIPVSQVTEGDVAQAITSGKVYAVAQVQETDLAQDVTRSGQSIPVGQTNESDVAQSISSRKAVSVGQVTESDLSQAISSRKIFSIGQVSESDLAQSIVVRKILAIAQAVETDLAQGITSRKISAISQVVESNIAQALTVAKQAILGLVSEADVAQSLTSRKIVHVGQVQETDVAQNVSQPGNQVISVGQVFEVDLAQAISKMKVNLVQQVSETDLAQSLFVDKRVSVAQVVEVDLALGVTRVKSTQLDVVTETDIAQPISRFIAGVIQQVLEVDLAGQISFINIRQVAQVMEVDIALSIAAPNFISGTGSMRVLRANQNPMLRADSLKTLKANSGNDV
jgi:hypothetical protein